jgi:hypothetical protein
VEEHDPSTVEYHNVINILIICSARGGFLTATEHSALSVAVAYCYTSKYLIRILLIFGIITPQI